MTKKATRGKQNVDAVKTILLWSVNRYIYAFPGTVLAAYISFGVSSAHLITASIMSAPAALCYSKLFYPEIEESKNKAENMIIERG
jgi:nucleoside permease NupC